MCLLVLLVSRASVARLDSMRPPHYGRVAEEIRSVVDSDAEQATFPNDDEIEAAIGVLFDGSAAERFLGHVTVEHGEIQILGVEVNRPVRVRMHGPSERFVEVGNRRNGPWIGVQRRSEGYPHTLVQSRRGTLAPGSHALQEAAIIGRSRSVA